MNGSYIAKYYLTIFGLIPWAISLSQLKGDYNWQLGLDSYPGTSQYPSSIEINFNNNQLKVDTFYRSTSMLYFNTSFSGDSGKLLLYSNGCQIRDGNHQYVQGSNHLSPGSVDDEWCTQNKIGYPIFEGGILLPFFNDSIIILLHQRLIIDGPPLNIFIDALFYTSILKNGSTYILDKKAIPILSDNSLTDGNLEAIKGMEDNTWWVMQGKSESNIYYTILFDSTMVDTIISQGIGDVTLKKGEAAGQAAFSPDGTIYARYTPADDLFLFDFDRATGLLSNYRKIHVADSGNIGGLAFSPNNRFLYVCARYDLYQFDLFEDDIENSKIHVGHYDGFADPFPATFYHMQLGPDCRIYIFPPNGINSMHIINYPDLKGQDCEFEQHGFHFPVSNSITIPNFPNYRLDLGPPCDPNIVSGFWEYKVDYSPVIVFPNPTNRDITIQLGEEWDNKGDVQIQILDQLGRVSIKDHFPSDQINHTFSLDQLPDGIYFLTVQSGQKWFTTRIIKI